VNRTLTADLAKERYPTRFHINGTVFTQVQLYTLIRNLIENQEWEERLELLQDVSQLSAEEVNHHY
jgi:hypothetical protein